MTPESDPTRHHEAKTTPLLSLAPRSPRRVRIARTALPKKGAPPFTLIFTYAFEGIYYSAEPLQTGYMFRGTHAPHAHSCTRAGNSEPNQLQLERRILAAGNSGLDAPRTHLGSSCDGASKSCIRRSSIHRQTFSAPCGGGTPSAQQQWSLHSRGKCGGGT